MTTAQRLRAQDMKAGQARVLLHQMEATYGEVSDDVRKAVDNASDEQVLTWSVRLLSRPDSPEDVIATSSEGR